jgi:hypothetical protein
MTKKEKNRLLNLKKIRNEDNKNRKIIIEEIEKILKRNKPIIDVKVINKNKIVYNKDISFIPIFFLVSITPILFLISFLNINIFNFIVGVISIYYTYTTILKYKETKKLTVAIQYTFFNILCLLAVYNFLLALNPFQMLELSSKYKITNILYFYLSFLIVTFDYNIKHKLLMLHDVLFEALVKTKDFGIFLTIVYTTCLFFPIPFYLLLAMFFTEYNEKLEAITLGLKFCGYLFAIMCVIKLFFYVKYRKLSENEIEKKYTNNIVNIDKLENVTINMDSFITDIFKLTKLNKIRIIRDDSTINCFNLFVTILTKYMTFIAVAILFIFNGYYDTYKINNEKIFECAEHNTIILLNNGNVVVDNFEKGILEEVEYQSPKYKSRLIM